MQVLRVQLATTSSLVKRRSWEKMRINLQLATIMLLSSRMAMMIFLLEWEQAAAARKLWNLRAPFLPLTHGMRYRTKAIL